MPIWCMIALYGQQHQYKQKQKLDHHRQLLLSSYHPIRIGDVEYNDDSTNNNMKDMNDVNSDHHYDNNEMANDDNNHHHDDDDDDAVNGSYNSKNYDRPKSRNGDNNKIDHNNQDNAKTASNSLEVVEEQQQHHKQQSSKKMINSPSSTTTTTKRIQKDEGEDDLVQVIGYYPLEPDPQILHPPTIYDFCIAILLILFGFVAMFAGLLSIHLQQQQKYLQQQHEQNVHQ